MRNHVVSKLMNLRRTLLNDNIKNIFNMCDIYLWYMLIQQGLAPGIKCFFLANFLSEVRRMHVGCCFWKFYRGMIDGYSHQHTLKRQRNISDKYLLLNQNRPSLWARLWTLQTSLQRVLRISWGYISTQKFQLSLMFLRKRKKKWDIFFPIAICMTYNTTCPGAGEG